MYRRSFIKLSAISLGILSFASTPLFAIAKQWKKPAFESDSIDGVLQELYGTSEHTTSDNINIKAPQIAENGAAVPIGISSSLENISSIAMFSSANYKPLVGYFTCSKKVIPNISTRIKLRETGYVTAVVNSNGKLYSKKQTVKVTIGGCGG